MNKMLLDIQGDINVIKNTMNELKKLSDEEKINLPKDVYLRNIFCHDCSLKKTCGNDPCENYEHWKEGYEKGLTEGKPKWHDLRKDSNDLPKDWQTNHKRREADSLPYDLKLFSKNIHFQ